MRSVLKCWRYFISSQSINNPRGFPSLHRALLWFRKLSDLDLCENIYILFDDSDYFRWTVSAHVSCSGEDCCLSGELCVRKEAEWGMLLLHKHITALCIHAHLAHKSNPACCCSFNLASTSTVTPLLSVGPSVRLNQVRFENNGWWCLSVWRHKMENQAFTCKWYIAFALCSM